VRPVNLIPPEEQGVGTARGPLRTGPAAYIVIGALALGLVMIIAMAVTNKQIDDQTAKKTALQSDLTAATERAESLRAFSDFRNVQEARTQTVSSLAQSRFDWERVLRELALILPSDVWLLKMSGTVSPAVSLEGGAEVKTRDSIEGPALEIIGCGPTQDAVAGFVAALEDIDGVTRVGVDSSSRNEQATTVAPTTESGAASEASEDCRYKPTDYQFEIVVAFDAVPTPPTASPAPSVPAPGAPSTSPQGSLAEAGVAADTTAQSSAAQQTAEAQQAADALPGGGG
jgi:Tfp pilus assembly protein PilN